METAGKAGYCPVTYATGSLSGWNSQFDQAYAAAQEGYRLSLEVGYGSGEHLAIMASLEATRGGAEEARTHLRAALELFRGLGIMLWEERAEAELRATGETARKRDPSALDPLTPQELQIAGLVAEGLTNRDIAARLYLSPRTIDYHLRKVFTKLGIGSRTELVRHGVPGYKPA